MIRQPHAESREQIVARALSEVVTELRMVEAADYIAFIRLEQFACVADIVDSAAELYLQPGTLKLGHGAEAEVAWDGRPLIRLDLELRPSGATVYFTLAMQAEEAGIEVNYVAFDQPSPDPETNTLFLEASLKRARITRTQPTAEAA